MRECSKKSVQQGRSRFDARSVHFVREHGNMARTPLAAFFNIPRIKKDGSESLGRNVSDCFTWIGACGVAEQRKRIQGNGEDCTAEREGQEREALHCHKSGWMKDYRFAGRPT